MYILMTPSEPKVLLLLCAMYCKHENSRLAMYGLPYMSCTYIYELIHDDHAVYACGVDRHVKVTQGQADII